MQMSRAEPLGSVVGTILLMCGDGGRPQGVPTVYLWCVALSWGSDTHTAGVKERSEGASHDLLKR